jgi:Fur family ferric uptake transcriptional regulator/Fur family peroxide stress response transcriptional regulator
MADSGTRKAGSQRLTPHRAAVLDVLKESCDHPTAAEIFRRVRRRRPGVACATIYNALNWLRQQGMIVELKSGDGTSRFDPIVARHDHLVCTACGALADSVVEIPRSLWARAGRRSGFRVQRYRLEVYGLCSRCARKTTQARFS